MTKNSDLTVRAGQSDNIDFQILTDADGDGIVDTPVNLSSGVDHIVFVLINSDTGGTTEYSSAGTKFAILAGTAGSVRFIPNGTADLGLTSAGKTNIYSGYCWVYSTATKKFAVPEEHEVTIRVRN